VGAGVLRKSFLAPLSTTLERQASCSKILY
jgi:hypothetical protein